jgi:hypothetical protein
LLFVRLLLSACEMIRRHFQDKYSRKLTVLS